VPTAQQSDADEQVTLANLLSMGLGLMEVLTTHDAPFHCSMSVTICPLAFS
jgi:hypothetical protein